MYAKMCFLLRPSNESVLARARARHSRPRAGPKRGGGQRGPRKAAQSFARAGRGGAREASCVDDKTTQYFVDAKDRREDKGVYGRESLVGEQKGYKPRREGEKEKEEGGMFCVCVCVC
jgi:hypothetical protein